MHEMRIDYDEMLNALKAELLKVQDDIDLLMDKGETEPEQGYNYDFIMYDDMIDKRVELEALIISFKEIWKIVGWPTEKKRMLEFNKVHHPGDAEGELNFWGDDRLLPEYYMAVCKINRAEAKENVQEEKNNNEFFRKKGIVREEKKDV